MEAAYQFPLSFLLLFADPEVSPQKGWTLLVGSVPRVGPLSPEQHTLSVEPVPPVTQ